MKKRIVEHILQRVKKALDRHLGGQMLSNRKGEGFDFAELMPYVEGVDARYIYWNSLAKGGALQFKRFYEEKEVTITVALLLSGSLRFGRPVEKYEKALEAAALIGYAAVESGNRFRGIALGEGIDLSTPAVKNPARIVRFLEETTRFDPLYHKIDPQKVSQRLFSLLKEKTVLIVVSDFLELYDFRRLISRHELFAVIVRDRFEAHPHPLGDATWCDPETGEEVELFFDEKRAHAYAQAYAEHDRKLFARFRRDGVRAFRLYTDQPATSLFQSQSIS